MPRTLLFDAYGTLFDITSIDRRLEHHFGDKAADLASLWRRKQLEYTWLRTLMERYRPFHILTEEALRYACDALMLTVDQQIINDLMRTYRQLEVFPDVHTALPRLSEQIPLAILSNGNPSLLVEAIAHNNIGGWLTDVFSADQVGRYKPAPEVYHLPVRKLGIAPAEMLFISANTWDIAGARTAGLDAIWLKRGSGVMEQLDVAPVSTIYSLDELVGRV